MEGRGWRSRGGRGTSCQSRIVGRSSFSNILSYIFSRPANADLEDLWDFGTVRHTGRSGTIGRAQNSIKVSGPPLTWEMNGSSREASSSSSITAKKASGSSLRSKTELPPLPSSPPLASASAPPARVPSVYEQATVRHMPSGGPSNETQTGHERESSDEDYDDQYLDTYPRGTSVQEKQHEPEDDELPDTTMLDSVILPAIASVRVPYSYRDRADQHVQLFPRVSTQEARVALSALQRAFNEAERIIPGVTMELVNEIVDSVERVEDDHQR